MNKNILNAVIVGSLAMGLASCDENSWNDHYLNGFEGGVDYNNKETGSYTVSDADYAAIAKMRVRLPTMPKRRLPRRLQPTCISTSLAYILLMLFSLCFLTLLHSLTILHPTVLLSM